jgi:hypothetical protein
LLLKLYFAVKPALILSFCSIYIEKLCSLVGISSLTVVSNIVYLFYNIAQAIDAENYLRLLNNSDVEKKFH